MIWLSANSEWTCGTFIELRDWGGINRVTWHPDGSETVFMIRERIVKEKDGVKPNKT